MLKIMHDARDPRLQLLVADILRSQLGGNDENRRAIFKLVQDFHVLRVLFPRISPEDFKSSGYAACFPLLSAPDDGDKDAKAHTEIKGGEKKGPDGKLLPPVRSYFDICVVFFTVVMCA